MIVVRSEAAAFAAIAFLVGLLLWTPAVGIRVWDYHLQPLDILVVLSVPLFVVFRAAFSAHIALVAGTLFLAFLLSFWSGGSIFTLAYYIVFILPFIFLSYLIAYFPFARQHFINGFLVGAVASAFLFLAQLYFGPETLDFRTNPSFRSPAQFGRGFALFPEVSTFAAHLVTALACALALMLHRATPFALRQTLFAIIAVGLICIMFAKSTVFLLIAPSLACFAIWRTVRAGPKGVMIASVSVLALGVLLQVFVSAFYVDRLESASATRSLQMRLASILAGLSPLMTGEIFGVGLGYNDLIRFRVNAVASQFGLRFSGLPEGVNSLIIGRVFEEGYLAIGQYCVALVYLVRAARQRLGPASETAILVVSVSAFLISLAVIGYRGIYLGWMWLAVAPALVAARTDSITTQRSEPACVT